MNNVTPGWGETLMYTIMPWMVLINQLPWIGLLVQILMALLGAVILHRIGTGLLAQFAEPFPFSRKLVAYGNRAGGVVVFFLITQVILRSAATTLEGITILRHLNALALIGALTWLCLRCVRAFAHAIIEQYPANAVDNLQARRIHTQTKVMARSVMVLIILAGTGMALMTLPMMRQIGTSLLASAGVAGLVVGLAAKPVLGNLLAGLQIAITQPIRLEDVVIVQGEWGHIEEITGTYVVIRIWDQRRLIVPLQWFIENPFQNWTRTTSDILGSAHIWVDYRAPLDAIRKEAERICSASPEWDGRVCVTQVVDTNERAMHLRILVSAADSGKAWDLRCRMREELIDFVQRNHPDCLPRLRADMGTAGHPDSVAEAVHIRHPDNALL